MLCSELEWRGEREREREREIHYLRMNYRFEKIVLAYHSVSITLII